MYEIAIVFLLLVAVAMIDLILIQKGKGAVMGAYFGDGASNTVFGSVGSGNFLTRSTWFLIFLFFAICLLLGYLQKSAHKEKSDFSNIEESVVSEQTVDQAPVVNTDAPVVETDAPSATDAPSDK